MALIPANFSDLITFTRGSAATRVNSSGYIETVGSNDPRFDYNPVTLASKGLLIEPAATNLITYSEALNSVSWLASGTTVGINETTAPTNTVVADKLKETPVNSTHHIGSSSVTFSSGYKYTISIYVKAAERSSIQISLSSLLFASGRGYVNFNLETETTNLKANFESSSITHVGNGWYRCVATSNAIDYTNTLSALFLLSDVSNPTAYPVYTGITGNGLYLWGAQVERSSYATSYIPTVGSTVTRNADSAILSTVSPWMLSSAGSLYAEFIQQYTESGTVASFNNASENEEIKINVSGADPKLTVTDGGVTQVSLDAGVIVANNVYKMAVTSDTNSFKACLNGGSVVTDTSGTLPTIDRLYLGKNGAVSPEYLNGWLRNIRYYPRILSDSELVSLTA